MERPSAAFIGFILDCGESCSYGRGEESCGCGAGDDGAEQEVRGTMCRRGVASGHAPRCLRWIPFLLCAGEALAVGVAVMLVNRLDGCRNSGQECECVPVDEQEAVGHVDCQSHHEGGARDDWDL